MTSLRPLTCCAVLFSALWTTALRSDAPPTPVPDHPVYLDAKAPLEDRVTNLIGYMTQDEKIQFIRSQGPFYFSSVAIPRLQVPRIHMVDAGQGVRGGDNNNGGPATLFASGVLMASTWDPALVQKIGEGIGVEVRNKGGGAQVLLGPGINIHRSPRGGRNGEYFSEDPFLASRLAVAYIEGLQSTGVAACVKHYACNNEEVDRGNVSVIVDERALREIYLPAFEAALREAHSWSLMAAYNKIRGSYMTANPYMLTSILRGDWGWDGEVVSDWGAVHETVSVKAGNDLDTDCGQMDGTDAGSIQAALKDGRLTEADIDRAVRDIVRLEIRVGLLDGPLPATDPSKVNSPAHQALSLQAAKEGIVLLKNENLLPLSPKFLHSVALIGPGIKDLQFGAEGSPHVDPAHQVEPFDAIRRAFGDSVTLNYAASNSTAGPPIPSDVLAPSSTATEHGLHAEYFDNPDLKGTPKEEQTDANVDFVWTGKSPVDGVGRNNFSVRWTGKITAPHTGNYSFSCTADDGCRVYVDNKLIIDHWQASPAITLYGSSSLQKGKSYDVKVEYSQYSGEALIHLNWIAPNDSAYEEAVAAAKNSDVAIVCVNTRGHEEEGRDRDSMYLPGTEDTLIAAVAAANPKTIVVLNNGTPIDMSKWLEHVPAVIESWFPGEEGGTALASILTGATNPSGKLPDTFGVHREDYPDYGNFPGVHGEVHYAEGIYVGYRHFDQKNITPAFPFGYGLSYTTFAYGKLTAATPALKSDGAMQVSIDVTNTGSRAGEEIVQFYIHDPHPEVDKAVRELKGFTRLSLQPHETKTATVTLRPRDLAYCDVAHKQWKAQKGDYEVQAGASSRDIKSTQMVHLDDDFTESIPHMQAPDSHP